MIYFITTELSDSIFKFPDSEVFDNLRGTFLTDHASPRHKNKPRTNSCKPISHKTSSCDQTAVSRTTISQTVAGQASASQTVANQIRGNAKSSPTS